MTIKQELHRLVDLIDDDADMEEALDYLRWLTEPCDSLTSEELKRIEKAEAAVSHGEYVTLEEIEQRLRH